MQEIISHLDKFEPDKSYCGRNTNRTMKKKKTRQMVYTKSEANRINWHILLF